MERLKRYSKQMVGLMSALVILVGGVLSTSFQSSASDFKYYLPYAQPPANSNQGYLTCIQSGGSVVTYFWTFKAKAVDDGDEYVAEVSAWVRNWNNPYFDFGAYGDVDVTNVYYDLYCITAYNAISVVAHNENQPVSCHPGDTVAVKFGGNIRIDDYPSSRICDVYYDASGSTSLLMEVIGCLNNSAIADDYIMNKLYSLLKNTDTIESQLSDVLTWVKSIKSLLSDIEGDIDILLDKYDDLIEEQKKSNTWLEKIWNALQEFLGLEGEESTEELEGKEESEELTEKEDELLNDDSLSTDDLQLDLDTNSSGTIWSMVDRLVQSNEKVFTALISILTLGIVALILNR